jgi:hypothetical protein
MEDSVLSKPIPEVLYHYCSVNSFYEIMMSQEIWLTNSRYFNDYGEVKHFEKLALKHLEKKVNEGPFKKAFLEKFRPTKLEYYVLCFSEEPNCLSQWRGYADDGKGVNIGFKISETRARNIFEEGFDFKSPFYYGPVIYDSEIANRFVEHYVSQFDGIDSPNPPAVEIITYILSCLAIFYKEEHFSEEQEYRLVYIPNTQIFTEVGLEDVLPDDLQLQKYFSRRDAVVPLRSFRLLREKYNEDEVIRNKIISEVSLGPRCRIQRRDLEGIFVKYGFIMHQPKINESKITYSGAL